MGVYASMSDPTEVFKTALSLDVQERAALAERLLASLNTVHLTHFCGILF
jgi:hypothetical protein